MGRKKKNYSLYKGDEEIAFGTIEEIAKKLGIREKTVYFYKSNYYRNIPIAKGKIKNRRELVVAEDENY